MTHKIFKKIKIGNYSAEKILKEYKEKGIHISDYAKRMINEVMFQTAEEEIDLVKLSVADMGFSDGATIDEIFNKAKELGLELCPQEIFPILRLDKDLDELIFCGMKQIDVDGTPKVFYLNRNSGGLWLNGNWAKPGSRWNSDNKFVFRLSKSFEPFEALNISDKEKIKKCIEYLKSISISEPIDLRVEEVEHSRVVVSYTQKDSYLYTERSYKEFIWNEAGEISMKIFNLK